MSLPINPTTVLAAARAARDVGRAVAETIADATGFDAVLADAGPQLSLEQLTARTAAAIRERLDGLGIAAGEPLELTVTDHGQLCISGSHPRAAEIESVLSADPQLSDLVGRLQAAGGPQRLIA